MKKIFMFISSIVVMLLLTASIDAQASQQFMTEDDARYFLSFIYNCNYEYDDIKNDQYFKMLTGKLEDETKADEIKLSFLTTMQAQINNNIDKSAYNSDILRSDLQSYLEEKATGMKDLPEQEYNAFLNKQLEVVENALVDWLCSVAATKAGIYVTQDILDNINLVSGCYSNLVGAPQKAIEYADYVINGVKAAMLPINEELTGRYSYFSVYLTNRKAYSDDTTFDIIMDYNKLAITQNYPLGTIDWYIGSKDSWMEHTDDIERWADITIEIEKSIDGVDGSSSSGSSSNPTPENTTITFTKDTYITDPSDYIGYAWNLNGYTVVVDNDLIISKNININNGALIVTGNTTQNGSSSQLNVGNGTLKINGNYYAQKGEFNAGSGKTEINGDFLSQNYSSDVEYSSTTFKMLDDNAYVFVNGDFYIHSAKRNTNNITAGTLEVKGNFTIGQSGGIANDDYGFPATGTHKVILSGTEKQDIYFSGSNGFNYLESTNELVDFTSLISVRKIIQNSKFNNLKLRNASFDVGDVTVLGDLELNCSNVNLCSANVTVGGNVSVSGVMNINSGVLSLAGNMFVGGNLNINTGTVNISGYLSQNGYDSIINVESGILKIGGNFRAIQGDFDAGSGKTEIKGSFISGNWNNYTWSPIRFKMSSDGAYVVVVGDFIINSYYSHSNLITAGVLEIRGNFTQKYCNFITTGTNVIILSGNNLQKMSFEGSVSKINVIVNKNPNVEIKSSRYNYLFTEMPYTLKFVTNSSKGTITKFLDSTVENTVINCISKLGVLQNQDNYFRGWYLDEEYTMPLTAENDIITSDMTLYAKWAEPMSFDNVSYSSENNEIYVNVSLDEELESQNGIAIITIYDGTKLITTHHTNAEETVSHTFKNVPIAENGYTVKAFCWSDFEKIIPLCESISTTVQ